MGLLSVLMAFTVHQIWMIQLQKPHKRLKPQKPIAIPLPSGLFFADSTPVICTQKNVNKFWSLSEAK